jgi:hypothetical protein
VSGDYFAFPIAADGKLYLATRKARSPWYARPEPIGGLRVNRLEEPIAATPAIANNALFVPTHSRLCCFRAQ